MTLEPDTRLSNRYRIIEKLGSGGMGAVYRAHDENLDVEVAVKENFFVSVESARQFAREARVLFQLKHPGLPSVIDHFTIPDQGQYLVMDYIQGQDARHILERTGGPLDQAEVMRWAKEILETLQYLHTRKPPIIHRDIKPANIKITPAGQPMLVDFGLAKEFDPTKSTTVGAKAFTPGFAPPEQYGQARTDPRTDVYALGATLYNLLTYQLPADGLRRAMGKEQLTPVRELNPLVSPEVAAAIEKATQVKPEDRFPSAEAFGASLFAGRTVFAPPPAGPLPTLLSESPPAIPTRPRRPILPLVIGAVILVAVGLGVGAILTGTLGGRGASPGGAPDGTPTLAAGPTEVLPTAIPEPTQVATDLPVPNESPSPEPTGQPDPTLVPTLAATPIGGGPGQIAFVSEQFGLPQVFLMNADGSEVTQLTNMPDGACEPAWSPAGDRLLFISPCREKRDSYPNAAIFVMNADGSQVSSLISRPGGVFDPDWSEKGIVFTWLESGLPGIWLAGEDGRNQVKLTRGQERDSQASWAPGGDKLVVMNTSRAGSPNLFWLFDDGSFNGSNPDQVTRGQLAQWPAWSPAGDLIAYVVDVHIWVVRWDAVGFGPVQLTVKGPNDGPAWSPDGQWIAFETWRDAANHDIYIMTSNGGEPTRLTTHSARDYHPAWRP